MLFQVAIFPTDNRGSSISAEVAGVIDLIDRSGLPYRAGAMSTTIEGSWDAVMPLLDRARKLLRRRHDRVYMSIAIDDRKGARNRLTGKIASLERELARPIHS